MNKRWRPSVTVAAVIEQEGRFLLVEEHTPEGLRLNNPAGHLEPGETPQAAVVREALEETGCEFVPEALLGVYMARFVRPRRGRRGNVPGHAAGAPRPPEDITYLRFAYRGRVGPPLPGHTLDPAIVRTLWLTREEIAAEAARHRSPLLMRCIDDYLAGRQLPLDAVAGDPSLAEPVVLPPLEPSPPGEGLGPAPGRGDAPAGRPSRSARRRARKKMQAMQDHSNNEGADLPPPAAGGPTPGAASAENGESGESATGATGATGANGPESPEGPEGPEGATSGAAAPAQGAGGPGGAPASAPKAPTASPALGARHVAQAAESAAAADAAAAVVPQAEPTASTSPLEGASAAQRAQAVNDAHDPRAAAPTRPEPTLAETAATLAERFPALFAPGQVRPIKLRIQADIQARSHGAFTRKQLSIFLHRHTTSTAYLRALVASPQRFDLDGQPAGEVAAEHVEAARGELERRRQIVMQRRAQQGRPERAGMRAEAGAGPQAGEAGGAGEPGRAGEAGGVAGAGRVGVSAAPGQPGDMPGAPAPTQRQRRPPRPPRPPRPGTPAGGGAMDRAGRPARGDRPDGPPNRPDRPDRAPQGSAVGRPGGPGAGGGAGNPGGRPPHRERPGGQPAWGSPPGMNRGDRAFGRPTEGARPPRRAPDEAPVALPADPERRERALLLRSFEGSPLTAANFSALKGLALPEFEAQIAQARREREERLRGSGTGGGAGGGTGPA
ncbi:MAG: NUDIX domain-containing protein [Rubrivivax sp.]|nr:NUDIX domain-containing protein [Rubrivivax sp.]